MQEEVVFADIHVEVAESPRIEVETLREAEVVADAAVGAVRHGAGEPLHRLHHAVGAHPAVGQTAPAFQAAVAHDDVAAQESFGHQRQPAVGERAHVGRGDDQMFVVRRFDAHVERHFGRDREAGVLFDLGGRDAREGLADAQQVFEEVVVAPHVDDHHLEIGVLLRQHQRKPLLDEERVLRKHGDDDRQRRFGVEHLPPPAVLVAGDAAVGEKIVPELYAQQYDEYRRQRGALPAVVGEDIFPKRHFSDLHNRFCKDGARRARQRESVRLAEMPSVRRQDFIYSGKDTNKPREKSKLACIFSEAKYLRRSQRYE